MNSQTAIEQDQEREDSRMDRALALGNEIQTGIQKLEENMSAAIDRGDCNPDYSAHGHRIEFTVEVMYKQLRDTMLPDTDFSTGFSIALVVYISEMRDAFKKNPPPTVPIITAAYHLMLYIFHHLYFLLPLNEAVFGILKKDGVHVTAASKLATQWEAFSLLDETHRQEHVNRSAEDGQESQLEVPNWDTWVSETIKPADIYDFCENANTYSAYKHDKTESRVVCLAVQAYWYLIITFGALLDPEAEERVPEPTLDKFVEVARYSIRDRAVLVAAYVTLLFKRYTDKSFSYFNKRILTAKDMLNAGLVLPKNADAPFTTSISMICGLSKGLSNANRLRFFLVVALFHHKQPTDGNTLRHLWDLSDILPGYPEIVLYPELGDEPQRFEEVMKKLSSDEIALIPYYRALNGAQALPSISTRNFPRISFLAEQWMNAKNFSLTTTLTTREKDAIVNLIALVKRTRYEIEQKLFEETLCPLDPEPKLAVQSNDPLRTKRK